MADVDASNASSEMDSDSESSSGSDDDYNVVDASNTVGDESSRVDTAATEGREVTGGGKHVAPHSMLSRHFLL